DGTRQERGHGDHRPAQGRQLEDDVAHAEAVAHGCNTLGEAPLPLVGRGWGRGWQLGAPRRTTTAPLPNPPPQGGREQAEFVARPRLTSSTCALTRAVHFCHR